MDFSVLDHVPAAIIFLNPKDEIVYFNKESERIRDAVNANFAGGESFLEVVPKPRRELVKLTLQQVRATSEKSVLESEYTTHDGAKCFFETTYSPLLISAQDQALTCVLIREITGEKIFQKKVTQLLRDYEDLIESAKAVIFSIDSSLYITEWNAECARITQVDKGDALAKTIDYFIAENCKKEFEAFVQAAFRGNVGNNFEFQFRTTSPAFVTILSNATLRINSHGKVIGILFVGQDITELSEYRTSLEQVVKDRTVKLKDALQKEKELVEIKNKFVSMASHELRIPLSIISSSAQFVRGKIQDTEARDKIKIIEKQIAHMRALIDDVLTLGKADVLKIKSSRQRLDIAAFIRKLSEEVSINAQQSHRVIVEVSHPVIEIDSDEKLLRNVFLNLLSNAVKFSPGRDSIHVAIHQQDNIVDVTVTDQGIGIAAQDHAKIFEPFNRASNATAIKGTGLGLSIVKRAVEVLGGTLELKSELGKGTSITVRFNPTI